MANELNIALPTSGLTVTAQPYQSGSAVGSAISLTEVGSSGFYSGTMTGSAGTYQLAFRSAGANVGSGSIVWSGTAEVPASTFNPASDTVANVTLCATTTTLTNAPTVPSASAIASQVRTELSVELGRVDQNISSRLAAADYVAPSAAPSVVDIRTELDANSTKLANLDASVSSRLADADYTAPTSAPSVADIRSELAVELGRLDASVSSRLAGSAYTAPTTPPTAAQIATAVEGSLLNEGDGQQLLNAIVGAIGNTNLSEVSLVAAVRADLERTGGKLDSIPTSSAPSASAVAGAVRTELGTELGRIDAAVSTRLASASYTAPTTPPTAAQNASAVRTELSTELGRVDAVKTRLDSINVDRVNNTATTNIVGTLLAQAQS